MTDRLLDEIIQHIQLYNLTIGRIRLVTAVFSLSSRWQQMLTPDSTLRWREVCLVLIRQHQQASGFHMMDCIPPHTTIVPISNQMKLSVLQLNCPQCSNLRLSEEFSSNFLNSKLWGILQRASTKRRKQ